MLFWAQEHIQHLRRLYRRLTREARLQSRPERFARHRYVAEEAKQSAENDPHAAAETAQEVEAMI